MVDLNRLKNTPVFRDLNPDLLNSLLAKGERRTMAAGDVVFKASEPYKRELSIILQGSVGIQRDAGQSYLLGEGDFVGLSSFLDNEPYSSTAIVETETELLVFSDSVFHGIKRNFHLITYGDLKFTVEIQKLVLGNNAFGFQSGVYYHVFVVDADNRAYNDGTGGKIGIGKALFKELGKAFSH